MARCRSCGADIVWARHHVTKSIMPLEIDPGGTWTIDIGSEVARPATAEDSTLVRYTSHFATCPNAAQHRRAR